MTTPERLVAGGPTPGVDYPSTKLETVNADIQSLNAFMDTLEASPMKVVFESTIAILTHVAGQDEMSELATLCSGACHKLETAIRAKDLDKLGDLEHLQRTVCEIEGEVRECANQPHDPSEHHPTPTQERIDAWRTELYGILNTFDVHSSQPTVATPTVLQQPEEVLGRGISVIEHVVDGEPSISDQHPYPASQISSPPPIYPALPHIPESSKRALRSLVSNVVSLDQLPSLIDTVVSNIKAVDLVKCLQGNDAQIFVDVMDEALCGLDLEPPIRKKCVESSYKMCAHHDLLPSSLLFKLPGGMMGDFQYRGGSADVLKRELDNRTIAVKALRPRGLTVQEVKKRFYKEVITWKSLRHPNVLPVLGVVMTADKFAMVSEWMPNGNINQFIVTRPDANRFELLVGVAKGLAHMHSQGMIHGDLKGANILVDQTPRACLADFGLLTIASDVTAVTSSNSFLQGGSCRWMSPELFDPEKIDSKDLRPTKNSDRYALGMVVYEVLSGQVPFSKHHDYVVAVKVSRGERPVKPRGWERMWFTDDIWDTLEGCWRPTPSDRLKADDVLHCLEKVSGSWTPPPLPLETVAGSPATNPFLDSGSEETTYEGDTTSSRVDSPWSLQTHSSKVLPCGAASNQDLETGVENPIRPDLGEFAEMIPPADGPSHGTSLRRRTACKHEASPQQSNFVSSGMPQADLDASGSCGVLVPRGTTERASWRDITTGSRSDVVLPPGTIFPVTRRWISNRMPRLRHLIFFFP